MNLSQGIDKLVNEQKYDIVIEKPEGKDTFDFLKNAGYDVRKDTTKPMMRYIVKKDDKDYVVDDYGWDNGKWWAKLKW